MTTVAVHFAEPKGVFVRWKVKERSRVNPSTVLFTYNVIGCSLQQFRQSEFQGLVESLASLKEGDILVKGSLILTVRVVECQHSVVMKDMCAECGKDLRKKEGRPGEREINCTANVAVVDSIPELMVTIDHAVALGMQERKRLLDSRKLVLLVDLDQTLIHTTNEDVNPNIKDVHHYQLYGPNSAWYHTRLRPNTRHFLEAIANLYELHICTFGVRLYAHKVAELLDPNKILFSHRILSRDECFDAHQKIGNLKALFPVGEQLVCIIDDREDVWNFVQNLVHVKPYRFFKHTGDINAPPGFTKTDKNTEHQFQFSHPKSQPHQCANSVPTAAVEEKQASLAEEVKQPLLEEKEKPVQSSAEVPVNGTDSDVVNDENGKPACSTSDTEEPCSSDKKPEEMIVSTGRRLTIEDNEFPNVCDLQAVVDEEVEDEDDYLCYLEEILVRIHKAFYQVYDGLQSSDPGSIPDLKAIVPYVKKKVLRGVRIVFSAVISTKVDPKQTPIYRAAVNFGAEIQDEIVPYDKDPVRYTTHLVIGGWGTNKVKQALRLGKRIHIVTPQWLWCCIERWEKAEPKLFEVTRDNAPIIFPQKEAKAGSGCEPQVSADLPADEEDTNGSTVSSAEECLERGGSTQQPLMDEADNEQTNCEPCSIVSVAHISVDELKTMAEEVDQELEQDDKDCDSCSSSSNCQEVDQEDYDAEFITEAKADTSGASTSSIMFQQSAHNNNCSIDEAGEISSADLGQRKRKRALDAVVKPGGSDESNNSEQGLTVSAKRRFKKNDEADSRNDTDVIELGSSSETDSDSVRILDDNDEDIADALEKEFS